MSAIRYRETLWSELYAGNRHTVTCLQPGVLATETALELAPVRRQRVVWRIDGGAGSDEQVCWLLSRGYQLMLKGISGRRAHALGRQVTRWDPYGDAWLGSVRPPIGACLPLHCTGHLPTFRQLSIA